MKISSLIAALIIGAVSAHAEEKKVDFVKEVQPILEKSCIQCHGPEKQKGGLRLDTREATLKGGKDALALVVGDATKSDMHRRVTLPKDNDDVMPSKGDLLTKTQQDLIRDWINQGANWPAGLALKSSGAATADEAKAEPVKLPDYKPTPLELKAIAKFEELGVAVRPIAQNVNWREANFRSLGTNASDTAIAPLKDVVGLMDLNLAGTKITDAGLASLKTLTNLTHLHLEHTQIGDAGLANLQGMANLEYLNLFDTKVTDAGLENLKGLTKLRNLHLWQTKVTEAGVSNLQKTLAKLNVDRGWEDSPAKKKLDAEKKEADAKAAEAAKKDAEVKKAADEAKKVADEAAKKVADEAAKKAADEAAKKAADDTAKKAADEAAKKAADDAAKKAAEEAKKVAD
ncbi:MAG: c-type cytochrome domain-containing protein, partial [Verrucomicrobiota bacterium]